MLKFFFSASIMLSINLGSIRLGVPPPKNIVSAFKFFPYFSP